MDWNKAKAEYIAGGTSYRKLAGKYGVTVNVLQKVAKREKWVDLKKQAEYKSNAKIVNAVSSDMAKKALKINKVADELLNKISEYLKTTPFVGSQEIKQCTSALKDIKDIKGLKSEIDLKEQEARIEKLRRDAEPDGKDDDKTGGVVMMPPIMDELTPPEDENNG